MITVEAPDGLSFGSLSTGMTVEVDGYVDRLGNAAAQKIGIVSTYTAGTKIQTSSSSSLQ